MAEKLTHTINKHGNLVFRIEDDTTRGLEEWHQEAFTRWASSTNQGSRSWNCTITHPMAGGETKRQRLGL